MSHEPDPSTVTQLVHHEDELRDQVLRNFLTLNGFLFATMAFGWKDAQALVYVVAALGVTMAVSTFAGVKVTEIAVRELRRRTNEHATTGLTSAQLHQIGGVYRLIPRLYPWKVLPLLIGAAWLAVILVRALS
jgi:hypothetical protein